MINNFRQFHTLSVFIICFLLQNSDLFVRKTHAFNFTLDQDFVHSAKNQLQQWIGYKNNQTFEEAIKKCQFFEKAKQFEDFYTLMYETGTNFTLKHIDVIRKQFKEHPSLKDTLSCIVDQRITDNPYLNEQKRYKYLARFVKSYDGYCKGVFPQFFGTKQKGRLIGHFFKAFFEYYYVNIYNPSQTLSTAFIRALTIRSDIFNHTDISYCLSLETAGAISNQLEGLDINNIYQKLPKFWQAFKYLKFKDKCKDEAHLQYARNLGKRIGNMDLYRLMYHDYQPYVQIAAEKFGTAQIRKLANKVAQLIDQHEKFTEMSHQDY